MTSIAGSWTGRGADPEMPGVHPGVLALKPSGGQRFTVAIPSLFGHPGALARRWAWSRICCGCVAAEFAASP